MTCAESIDGAAMVTEVPYDAASLCEALIEQRQYTLALYADLPNTWWEPSEFPFRQTINPPLWELAHIAWFQEFFALRWRPNDVTGTRTPSCADFADRLFDSARILHSTRWQLAYPPKSTCLDYMQRVLGSVVDALAKACKEDRYGFQLALVHEDMHAEALAMTLTTLGLPLPEVVPKRELLAPHHIAQREIACTGGTVNIGASQRSFAFDNEKPPQIATLAPFAIDARVVNAEEFAIFAKADAYRDPHLWSAAGNDWRERDGREERQVTGGQIEGFAAIHVNYFEAEAYCRWCQRRLPTEVEWENAATSSNAFLASSGHVWEWTASAFAPYPGFQAERYSEYSEPWFDSHGIMHRVLKGGSFVTHPRLKYPQYRNFYTPQRRDMFCGFRTCAIA